MKYPILKLAAKLVIAPLAIPLMMLTSSTYALAGEDVSVSVSTDYVSEYVYRGVTLAGEAFQPGAEISVGNFTAGVWASVAIGEESNFFGDEVDIYGGYSFPLSETITADVGATLYHYPQLGGVFDIGTGAGDASTLELYGGLGFDAPFAPSITAYYDFTLEAFTVIGGAEYAYPLGEKTSFDISGAAGFVSVDGAGDYQYGTLSGAVSYAFTDTTSAYFGGNVGLSSENTFADVSFDPLNLASIEPADKSSVWFGVGISSGF